MSVGGGVLGMCAMIILSVTYGQHTGQGDGR